MVAGEPVAFWGRLVRAAGAGLGVGWSVWPIALFALVLKYLGMARGYRPVERDQQFLLPVSMADWLPEDHLVWFIIDAVDRLDTRAFHTRARLGGVGRAGYDPDMLLTLFVYAMAHGARSSRKIERLCHTDVAFRIICAQDIPDHTVLARFRQEHELALGELLTASLHLAAGLGMVRLGVVAFDGVKIAAAAALAANRGEDGLRKLAEQYLAGAAETDAAEDALFGSGARGDEPPPDLRDRTGRRQRIQQALDQIAADKAAAEQQRQAGQATAAQYVASLSAAVAGGTAAPTGRTPKAADPVTVALLRWQRARAKAQAAYEAWHAKAAVTGRTAPGSKPLPADRQPKVSAARAALDTALTQAQNTTTGHCDNGKIQANLTDPQSRIMKTRNGWIQGYNCQTAASEDQFIIHAEPTRDANDVHQFQPTADAVTNTAAYLSEQTGRQDLTIGVMIGDAGYDSDTNLTLDGPDRLIANAKHHKLAEHATTSPATGQPPDHATARQRMDHRLRTPEGQQFYKRRAPLIEAPHGWLKDRRGLRQFSRRGLQAVRSELRFAAAVTNLLRLRTLGITTTGLATQ